MPTISVIIPTYNYGRFIGEAIESVLKQTLAASEVIVVDDGSTDNTLEIVREFGSAVKYIRQANSGVCEARNRGVSESVGELIAFLDADDVMEPASLEKQTARFVAEAGVGLVHCGLRLFDSDSGRTVRIELNGGEDHVADSLLLWEGPAIPGPGAGMVSRRAFDAVGGFDPGIKVGEDWDFCYRVARQYKVRFVPEILVHYRSHSEAAHRNVAEMERGMLRFYEKAFSTNDTEILRLRRRAYGNFYKVMAGSYFRVGEYGAFVRSAILSIWNRPSNLRYFAAFPLRRISRAKDGSPER